MNVTDPIADLLTRIRNAQKARHEVVTIPASKMKIAIVYILKETGYIKAFKCIKDNKQGLIKVALKYDEAGRGVITQIKRVSNSGCRYYLPAEKIPQIRRGYGLSIFSTSKGVMTGRDARSQGVGGEFLCSVY